MTQKEQHKKLGDTLWGIANDLRGAMNVRPETIEKYSRRVSIDEIEKNGYNLNISRYVSTAEDEVQIDLGEVNEKLIAINEQIEKKTQEHNEFLKELGLKTI